MDLTGKKILFVGDSSGLDNSIINQIHLLGGITIVCDDLHFDTIEATINGLSKNIGPFDGMVYGVVHSNFRPLQLITPRLVDEIMHDNYGLFIEVIRIMRKTHGLKDGASVVAMSSISSIRAMKAKTIFCSAKAALDAAIRCLAVELGDKGIRLNSVQKGRVDVDMEKSHIQDIASINGNIAEKKQILSLTRAVEIANVVAFLLSDATTTITGTSIVIDGGYTL